MNFTTNYKKIIIYKPIKTTYPMKTILFYIIFCTGSVQKTEIPGNYNYLGAEYLTKKEVAMCFLNKDYFINFE